MRATMAHVRISKTGRGSRIRTCDLKYPKLPRYQTALFPGGSSHTAAPVRGAIHGSDFASKTRGTAKSVRLRAVGAHFGRHHALRTGAETHQHGLAGAQLGDAEAAQRLHVDEDVRRAVAAGDEAESAQPVEPQIGRASWR